MGKNKTDTQQRQPWDGDVLGRKIVAEHFTKILMTLDTPHVVSINAAYGMGKSFFMSNWYEALKSEHTVFFFNAWENDFSDDPLMAFVFELQQQAAAMGLKTEDSAFTGLLQSAGRIGLQTLVAGVEKATFNMVDLEKISEQEKQETLSRQYGAFADTKLKAHLEVKEGIQQFKRRLEEIAEKAKEKNPNSKLPVIIFIDELDRCRPSFAVQLLENIKHIFSTKNYIFVLGMDRSQLKHTIGVIYGQNMDSEGYLRRFIDLELSLPMPRASEFIDFMVMSSKLYRVDTPAYVHPPGANDNIIKFASVFSEYAEFWRLTLREQKQIFKELELSMLYLSVMDAQMLPFMGILKAKDKELYAYMGETIFDYNKVIEMIELKTGRVGYHLDSFSKNGQGSMMEGLWVHLEKDFSRFRSRMDILQRLMNGQDDDGRTRKEIETEYRLLAYVIDQASKRNFSNFYNKKRAPIRFIKDIIDIGSIYTVRDNEI